MSLIALGREYPSIFSAPVISAVDPAIFSLRYFTHCMSCGFCFDQCCNYGVDIDAANMEPLARTWSRVRSVHRYARKPNGSRRR